MPPIIPEYIGLLTRGTAYAMILNCIIIISIAMRGGTSRVGACQSTNAGDMSHGLKLGLKRGKRNPEMTYTRAPENIPAAPTPAIARPMIKATDVGAAPHTTKMMLSTRFVLKASEWKCNVYLNQPRT